MMRAWHLSTPALLVACSLHAGSPANAAPSNRQTSGTAIADLPAPASNGEILFDAHCAICHSDGKLYPGTMQLRRNGLPQPVLGRRSGLNAEYVKLVARGGIGPMPGFTPVQLPNADLEKIAQWLAGHR